MAATAMKKEKNATAKKHSESEDRSSSLSPEPAPGSRQSTPLSELSPPPDDDDEDDTKQEGKDADGEDKSKGPPQRDAPLLDQSQPKASASPVATPAPGGQLPDPTVKPKFVLELNEELLKALIELQNRKTPYTDLLYRAYGARVESNLAWAARVADPNTAKFNFSLPMMEAPPPIDLYSTERIQEMYAQLPTMFATDIARSQSGSNALKRERPEELPMDGMNKRRDTGESKVMTPDGASAELAGPMGGLGAGSGMLPRPNGTATPPPTQSSPQNPGMGMQPQQQHTMMNQAIQMRQQQQQQQQQQLLMQRQMSPPSAGVGGNGMPNSGNAAAGPSGLGGVNVASLPPVMQQMYAILTQQGARHQLVQHLLKLNPNFLSMPVNAQLQQMAQFYAQRRQQGLPPVPMGNNAIPPTQNSPVSPIGPGGGNSASSQMMFPGAGGNNSPGMDLRSMSGTPGPQMGGQGSMGGMGTPGGMGGQGMSPQQRQLMLMQQQQARGMGGAGPMGSGGMNPASMGGGMGAGGMGGMSGLGAGGQGMGSPMEEQARRMQQIEFAQREQAAKLRMRGAGTPGMGTPGSPMMGGQDFPALRSNNPSGGMPGIARIARSPSDGGSAGPGGPGQGGMGTPRMTPSRMPDEYQQAMMGRNQGGVGGMGMGGQPGMGLGGMMGMGMGGQGGGQGGWGQQGGGMMGMGGMGVGGMGGGAMQRPNSAYGGAPSPPGSGNPQQNWGGGGGNVGFFGNDMGRQMAGTPGPGGAMAPQMAHQNPGTDPDYDPFNWG